MQNSLSGSQRESIFGVVFLCNFNSSVYMGLNWKIKGMRAGVLKVSVHYLVINHSPPELYYRHCLLKAPNRYWICQMSCNLLYEPKPSERMENIVENTLRLRLTKKKEGNRKILITDWFCHWLLCCQSCHPMSIWCQSVSMLALVFHLSVWSQSSALNIIRWENRQTLGVIYGSVSWKRCLHSLHSKT